MGSNAPVMYYSFYCEPVQWYGALYQVIVSCACSIAFIVTLMPHFEHPSLRKVRGGMFVGIGVGSAFSFVHLIFFSDPLHMLEFRPFFFILGGAFYVGGAGIFVSRVPERFFPGRFDLVGQSHNIWHAMVLAGALCHFYGSLQCFHYRRMVPCPPCEA